MSQATRQQQVLLEAVKGVGEEVTVATLLQVSRTVKESARSVDPPG